jgi:hypothetical protein
VAKYKHKPIDLIVEAVKPSFLELMDVTDPQTGQRQKVPYPPDSMIVSFPNGRRVIMPEKVLLSEFELMNEAVPEETPEEKH